MAVFRVEKNKNYTIMSNHHLRNSDLTLKAKGLLSQMLSLPEDWDYTLKGLSLINKERIDAIRTAVWELEKNGYITRSQGRDDKGKMTAIEYIIFEQPQPPILENPIPENPISENPMQLNKDILSKELLNTDVSSTYSIPIHSTPNPMEAATPEQKGNRNTNMDVVRAYEEVIKDNIEYGYLCQDTQIDTRQLNEIVSLILETVCSNRRMIRIAGDDYPSELVKTRFMKLDGGHIRFVIDCMKQNTTQIRNMKQYLLAVLFNAPTTIENYYSSLVNHDLHGTN